MSHYTYTACLVKIVTRANVNYTLMNQCLLHATLLSLSLGMIGVCVCVCDVIPRLGQERRGGACRVRSACF